MLFRSVGEEFVPELTCSVDEADVELQLRDVDTEYGFSHGGELLLSNQRRRGSNLRIQAQLLAERLRILSDLIALALRWAPGARLTH